MKIWFFGKAYDLDQMTVEDVEKYNEESLTFNIKDKKGNTPLYYALSRNPSLDVAKKIIE